MNCGAMLNAYPDSMGGTLGDIARLLESEAFRGVFRSFYILPSVFTTDLDRGFSVISYDLNDQMTAPGDMDRLTDGSMVLPFSSAATLSMSRREELVQEPMHT